LICAVLNQSLCSSKNNLNRQLILSTKHIAASTLLMQNGGKNAYTEWLKLKYPSSKFAISWQSFGILPCNLQHR